MERIQRASLLIRGEKVMLDADLAAPYGVEVRALTQAVKRNPDRFPPDFMFPLTWPEARALRSQTVILNGTDAPPHPGAAESGRGKHRKYRPYAFTEQGVAMLSSVLKSAKAVQVNVAIMRVFVQLRRLLGSHVDPAPKLEALERKYDAQFKVVFDAIRELMSPPEPKRKSIGYHSEAAD